MGRRFFDATAGNEVELMVRTVDAYGDYVNIVDSPPDQPTLAFTLDLDYPLNSGIIRSTAGEESIDIQVVEDQLSFLTNPVTRFEGAGTIQPEGTLIASGIAGIEMFNAYPTGYLLVQTEASPLLTDSTLYYHVDNINDVVDEVPYSGNAFGLGYVGMGPNGGYEVLLPTPAHQLRREYPIGPWTTPTGVLSTPPDGASLFETFVNDNDEIEYRYQAYNNPYGSGVYNLADTELTFKPL
ncbi:unnamed protein product, partial [marine sediment metagenome]